MRKYFESPLKTIILTLVFLLSCSSDGGGGSDGPVVTQADARGGSGPDSPTTTGADAGAASGCVFTITGDSTNGVGTVTVDNGTPQPMGTDGITFTEILCTNIGAIHGAELTMFLPGKITDIIPGTFTEAGMGIAIPVTLFSSSHWLCDTTMNGAPSNGTFSVQLTSTEFFSMPPGSGATYTVHGSGHGVCPPDQGFGINHATGNITVDISF
jgi:hypothetical protein